MSGQTSALGKRAGVCHAHGSFAQALPQKSAHPRSSGRYHQYNKPGGELFEDLVGQLWEDSDNRWASKETPTPAQELSISSQMHVFCGLQLLPVHDGKFGCMLFDLSFCG